MSFEWTSQPLSLQSIATQYTLPIVIRSAPGFRGSSRPFILHSTSRITFAFGRALKVTQSTKNGYQAYRPLDAEIVAIPLEYPGYFECLSSSRRGPQDGVVPEKNIRVIVDRMELDHRPQAFYTGAPLRIYTFEKNSEGITSRFSHQIEAHQMILFDKLTHIEYTPREEDKLTVDDYAFSWWLCYGKHILNRNEHTIKCILSEQQICYIPCSTEDEVCLFPVGQRGSNNIYKFQTTQNLIEQFPLPTNIKLAQLPGSYAYKDFSGHLQLLGSRTEELAVCASLSTTNISVIPTNTPLKFVVAPLSSSPSKEIKTTIARCRMFVQSFDMQIRRLLISTCEPSLHRSRSKYPRNQGVNPVKRSISVGQQLAKPEDQTTTDEGYRSGLSTEKKRNNFQRAISVEAESTSKPKSLQKAFSIDNNSTYNSLVHPVRPKTKSKQSSSSSASPPPLPKKPANFPYPSTYDSGSNIVDELDLPNADGAILMDDNNELFLALASDSRLS